MMKKLIISSTIASVATFFSLGAVQATPSVCLAITLNEAYACQDGQVLAISMFEAVAKNSQYQNLFNALASRIIGTLCAPDQAIVFVPNWTINCTVQKKPNAAEILGELLTKEKQGLEEEQKKTK